MECGDEDSNMDPRKHTNSMVKLHKKILVLEHLEPREIFGIVRSIYFLLVLGAFDAVSFSSAHE